MSNPRTDAGTLYCDATALREFTTKIFEAFGLPRQDAAIVAENLVHADLRGHAAHGVTRISIYAERLRKGVVKARPRVRIEHPRPTVALVDGDNGCGAVVGDRAMKEAISLARQSGVGLAAVSHSNHNGPGSYFAMQALEHGFIGASATNPPISMAVWGSRGRALGTNPFAVAIPAGHYPALVVDMSSSVVARGKVVEAAKRGETIPEGWALDPEGHPTTDAKAGEAGVVLPFGGAKGSAIAILVDVFSGVLAGASFGSLVKNLYADFVHPQDNGHFLAAVDVTAFMPLEQFKDRMDLMIRLLKGAPLAQGAQEILMPGEPEFRNEQRRLRTGVALPRNVVEDIREVAGQVRVALPALAESPLG